ncbi:MAG: hypothetical protein JWP87_2153 [Labilithrix sp.]|nr:hypothetical protein [Labilithrix sp.]
MKIPLLGSGLLAAALALTPGCNSGSRSSDALGFAADPPSEAGASVFLRAQTPNPAAPDLVVVDVVARGTPDLHGAAFRVTWDPEALGFIDAKSASTWSKKVLSMAKEGSPGQLAVAWAERGETALDASGDTLLGTLEFYVRARKPTAIAFKTERSQVVDKKGASVAVKWVGGSILER